jgi:hypothetical protein
VIDDKDVLGPQKRRTRIDGQVLLVDYSKEVDSGVPIRTLR